MESTRDTTLWGRWLRLAESEPDRESICVLLAGEEPQRWTRGQLISRARQYASWLAARGVTAGDTCALILRHHAEFYPLYMGIVALGALPAVLAYPNSRLHPDKFRSGLSGMARRSGLDWIVSERDLEAELAPLLEGSKVRALWVPNTSELAEEHHSNVLVDPDAPALLQHSSGTTGLQKGVVLSHRAILRHVDDYARAIEVRGDDRIVSWLPLYHDMGLIAAFHLPLALGLSSVQLAPFEWIAAPILWVEALSNESGTLSWLPNFAYSFMAERLREDELEGLSLSQVRMLINCSEPVRDASHAALLAKLGPYGLKATALAASYAMAETTFAVTQTAPGRECTVLPLSRVQLSEGRAALPQDDATAQRTCVSSGRPLRGCEVRIVDAAGEALRDLSVGEILVRSPTAFDGYRNNPEETQRAFRDGWYVSGDLGFTLDGELFVVGRKKDLIIVAGKNLYPEDIEDALNQVPDVVPGRVIAFGREDTSLGTEKVCVIVESPLEPAAHAGLRTRVIAAGQTIDVTISEVYVVPPRWLIKSSSGKPSRSDNRARIGTELERLT